MTRLDTFLLDKKYCESRTLAAKLIEDGCVFVNGKLAEKPSLQIGDDAKIEIKESSLTKYVSRGGLKLEAALEHFNIDPTGFICADIGASTGGFTDCLLAHGAEKVYAVDSGSSQLHKKLLNDERVISLENTNARFLDSSLVPPVDLVVMDVSFISQKLLYPAVLRILKPDKTFISLIKPQFEAGREFIGSGGIVRDTKIHEKIKVNLIEAAQKLGLVNCGIITSPIKGGDGNTEYLACFKKKPV